MTTKGLTLASIVIALLTTAGCTNQNGSSNEGGQDNGMEQVSGNSDLENTIIQPPNLTIHVGEETIIAEIGTYSWTVDLEDGTHVTTIADAAAPHEIVKMIDPTPVEAGTSVELDFEEEPDNYTVKIWDEDGSIVSESSEVELSGEGEIIYEVLAHWDSDTVSYAFSLEVE